MQLVYTILTAASTNREYTAGSGMPLPYKACAVGRVPQNLQLPMALAERRYSQICKHARSAMPLSILAAPPVGITTSALGLLAMTNPEASHYIL